MPIDDQSPAIDPPRDLPAADTAAPVAYDSDYALWIDGQIAALWRGDWRALDIENLTDELQDVGHCERDGIESRLKVLLVHLLKWHFQPHMRSQSWAGTIEEQRDKIERRIRRSPSLRRWPQSVLNNEYRLARRPASSETGLPLATFPEACPYSIDDILDPGFWPGPAEPRID